MNERNAVLEKSTISGNILILPNEQLDRKVYQDVAKALNGIGGKWNKKQNGFLFDHDPSELLTQILSGGKPINLQKEFQFFQTPDDVADFMVREAFIQPHHKVAEPEAGQGALIKAMRREGHLNNVWYWELMEQNLPHLEALDNVTFVGRNFLTVESPVKFDVILANPPFSKNQDIDHILKMWDCLADRGRIVTVASKHWNFSTGKKEEAFKKWTEEVETTTYDLEGGRFKKSGTMVSTQILVIDK